MGIQPNLHHIFSGLAPSFINQLKMHASQLSFCKGGVLFKQGRAASHFFILIEGYVALCIGRRGNVIYKIKHEYEDFGWSSLTGCDVYTASAVCIADTVVLRFDADKLKALLTDKSAETLRFYQNLSRTLDKRLQKSYGLHASISGVSKQKNENKAPIRDCFNLL